jgi:hypothetical protein
MTYDEVYSWDNLWLAWRKAAKGKRSRPAAAGFEYHLEDNLIALQEELATKTYRPGAYASFYIHEPKRRLISAAPFRDRVVHHALCNIIEPAFERSFSADSYANRIGKGTHRALDRCQEFARRFRYVLQCDVRQFFPSVDHAVLNVALGRKVRDPAIVWLIRQIITSGVGVLSEEYDMVYFPGDDLFAAVRPRGLPIGNLTSQFWANCYLSPFDHFVQNGLRCPAYLRYVDDFLLFGDDKQQLWDWRQAVVERLARLRLTIHEASAQVRPVTEGIPFLGFTVFPQQRRLKRRKGIIFRRKLCALAERYADGEVTLDQVTASVQGWINHVRYANTVGLRQKTLGSVPLRPPKAGKHGCNTALHENL